MPLAKALVLALGLAAIEQAAAACNPKREISCCRDLKTKPHQCALWTKTDPGRCTKSAFVAKCRASCNAQFPGVGICLTTAPEGEESGAAVASLQKELAELKATVSALKLQPGPPGPPGLQGLPGCDAGKELKDGVCEEIVEILDKGPGSDDVQGPGPGPGPGPGFVPTPIMITTVGPVDDGGPLPPLDAPPSDFTSRTPCNRGEMRIYASTATADDPMSKWEVGNHNLYICIDGDGETEGFWNVIVGSGPFSKGGPFPNECNAGNIIDAATMDPPWCAGIDSTTRRPQDA